MKPHIMKITFHGAVQIEPTINGHSTITTKVSGCIYDTNRAFYDLWEEIGDEPLKQLLRAEGFDMVKLGSELEARLTSDNEYLKARIEYLQKQEQRALKHFPDSISTQEIRYLKERREELEEVLKRMK